MFYLHFDRDKNITIADCKNNLFIIKQEFLKYLNYCL